MDAPKVRVTLYILLLALLLVTVGSDWPTGLLTQYWSDHAMLTNIVSSLIFVALGATIVERWSSRQSDKRFSVIESTTYEAVANTPLGIRRALWFLVNGGRVLDDEDFKLTDDEADRLALIFQRHGFSVASEKEVSRGNVSVPSDVARLAALIHDPDWLALAHPLLLRTVHTSRLAVARWAHLLITTRQSANALNDLVAVIEDLRALVTALNPVRTTDVLANDDEREAFVTTWRMCFVNAAIIYEDFMLGARTPGFVRWSPELTQSSDAARLTELNIQRDKRSRRSGAVYSSSQLPSVTLATRQENVAEPSGPYSER